MRIIFAPFSFQHRLNFNSSKFACCLLAKFDQPRWYRSILSFTIANNANILQPKDKLWKQKHPKMFNWAALSSSFKCFFPIDKNNGALLPLSCIQFLAPFINATNQLNEKKKRKSHDIVSFKPIWNADKIKAFEGEQKLLSSK